MAKLTITPLVMRQDLQPQRAEWVQTCEDPTLHNPAVVPESTPWIFKYYEIIGKMTREVEVGVSRLVLDQDPASLTFYEPMLFLDMSDPRVEALRADLPKGWVLTEEGRLMPVVHANGFFSPDKYSTLYDSVDRFMPTVNENEDYMARYERRKRVASEPSVKLILTEEDQGCEVDYIPPAFADRPVDAYNQRPSLLTDVIAPSVEAFGCDMAPAHYEDTFRRGKALGVDFWGVLKNWTLYEGFKTYYESAHSLSVISAGKTASALKASGAPTPEELERRSVQLGATQLRPGRKLAVCDTLQPGAVGNIPFGAKWVLSDAKRELRRDFGYRGSRRFHVRNTSVGDAIILGLSQSQTYFTQFDHEKLLAQYPKVDTTAIHQSIWEAPGDRFVFQRSAWGFHGLFVLRAGVKLTNRHTYPTTCQGWLAYCVPVFIAFSELRNIPNRHRLPEALRGMISATYGLADFLAKALLTLQGAKLMMARKGITLDGFEIDFKSKVPAKLDLPKGHMIRTWGVAQTAATYDLEQDRNMRASPYTWRACSLAAEIIRACDDKGKLASGKNEALTPERVALQPVARSRRLLEV